MRIIMANHDLDVVETFSPSSLQIDFLTEKINEESRAQSISSDAYPFGIFLRRRKESTNQSQRESINPPTRLASASELEVKTTQTQLGEMDSIIVGGCNGSIVYGSIYTDQLWIDSQYRGKGLGKQLMEKVHDLGRSKSCRMATVGTMDFQGALKFYQRLGYEIEFQRDGYDNGGKMIYLKKHL